MTVRPTLRCLRDDLHLPLPDADGSGPIACCRPQATAFGKGASCTTTGPSTPSPASPSRIVPSGRPDGGFSRVLSDGQLVKASDNADLGWGRSAPQGRLR
jgi:hypothetical protein